MLTRRWRCGFGERDKGITHTALKAIKGRLLCSESSLIRLRGWTISTICRGRCQKVLVVRRMPCRPKIETKVLLQQPYDQAMYEETIFLGDLYVLTLRG